MRAVALLAACFALACGGRGPWRAISREAETAADIISQREGGALTAPLREHQDGIRVAGTMIDKAEAPKFVFDVEHGTTKLTPYAIGPDEAVWRGSEVKMSKPTLWHLERRAEEEREAKEEM